nr:hypothetical protein [uncultured Pseudomonas sp.]
MTITCNLKASGVFSIIENADGGFDVRDPYGKIECNRKSKEIAQRIADAANKAMRDWNDGDRISHGGDI